LGTLGGDSSVGYGINAAGQVTGWAALSGNSTSHAFLYSNGTMTDLGTLYGYHSVGMAINDAGEVTGYSFVPYVGEHAFVYSNGTMSDQGTLGGCCSSGIAINAGGQITGSSYISANSGNTINRAFLYTNGAMIDLGAGDHSTGMGINTVGEVVGAFPGNDGFNHPFLYVPGGGVTDLNFLIAADSGWKLDYAAGINDSGQITGLGIAHWEVPGAQEVHAFLLNPIYRALIQQPINADGTSVFSAKRGVVPVKFNLTQHDAPTCTLLPATVAITRTAGGTLGAIDENTYVANADSGSDFRINGCQYAYNLAASSLGIGTYRVDISINGIMVGHAVFALK
jgi:probable HAF family extracellular repeat protein